MAASFQALVDAHFHRVHRAAYGFLGDPESAREAAQEALLKAYAARARYDAGRPFYPWIYRIVRNVCLDLLAQRKRRPLVPFDDERAASSGPAPDELLRRKQDAAQLWRAMETLSADQREIVNLRHFQDLTYAEIAELLDVAEGTVMSRLFRARRALAQAMEVVP